MHSLTGRPPRDRPKTPMLTVPMNAYGVRRRQSQQQRNHWPSPPWQPLATASAVVNRHDMDEYGRAGRAGRALRACLRVGVMGGYCQIVF